LKPSGVGRANGNIERTGEVMSRTKHVVLFLSVVSVNVLSTGVASALDAVADATSAANDEV
jgi:hypothetical protein